MKDTKSSLENSLVKYPIISLPNEFWNMSACSSLNFGCFFSMNILFLNDIFVG